MVGVEVLTHPKMLIQLPNGNAGIPADVGVLHYHGIRGLEVALDAVASGLLIVSSPSSPKVALRRAEKTKFEKYWERVRSRPDIRFIPFAVTEFGTLGGHATGFLTELTKHASASKGMHVGKLLASFRRKVSLAVYVAHADNILRGFCHRFVPSRFATSCAAVGVEAVSSSIGMPSLATALFTRAMGRMRPRASSSGA
jgi:hypothetical protein